MNLVFLLWLKPKVKTVKERKKEQVMVPIIRTVQNGQPVNGFKAARIFPNKL